MNKTFLLGRLTRNPELRYTSSNIPCCSFTLAVNRDYTNQEGQREADFINIITWKNQAENCQKYLTKGSFVAIDGRIQTRSYDTEENDRLVGVFNNDNMIARMLGISKRVIQEYRRHGTLIRKKFKTERFRCGTTSSKAEYYQIMMGESNRKELSYLTRKMNR